MPEFQSEPMAAELPAIGSNRNSVSQLSCQHSIYTGKRAELPAIGSNRNSGNQISCQHSIYTGMHDINVKIKQVYLLISLSISSLIMLLVTAFQINLDKWFPPGVCVHPLGSETPFQEERDVSVLMTGSYFVHIISKS